MVGQGLDCPFGWYKDSCIIANGAIMVVVDVRQPIYTGNGVTEVGYHTSSSQPFPSPALKRIGYTNLLLGEQNESSTLKLCFEPGTFSTSGELSNRSVTAPFVY